MKFSLLQLTNYTSLIEKTIQGHQIRKIKQLNDTDFFIFFGRKNDVPLFFSFNNDSPFIGLWRAPIIFNSLDSIIVNKLTKVLTKTHVVSIFANKSNRIVIMKLCRLTDAYKKIFFYVYFELIPGRSNLIVTGEDNKILITCRHSPLKQKAGVIKGEIYQMPPRFVDKDRTATEETLEHFFDYYWPKAYANHLKSKYGDIFKLIKRKLNQLINKQKKIEADYNRHLWHLDDKQKADLLITYQDQIDIKKPIVIEGVTINIDPALSLFENAAKNYRQYRKARRGVNHVRREQQFVEQQLKYFSGIDKEITQYDDIRLAALQNELIELNYLQQSSKEQIKQIVKHQDDKLRPSFIIDRGVKYSFGKNSKQNDYLTFTLADKDDWFFHVKDYPGAHVIIHHPSPTDQQIRLASEIAIIASKLSIGEVSYAQVKTLKKGKRDGLVLMNKHRSLRINELILINEDQFANAKR